MDNIQFIQTTPNALANLIAENVREQLETLSRQLQKQATEPGKELMTRKETADLFSVSLVTIHDWVKAGIIKPYKVGNRTFFKRTELMEVVNQSNTLSAMRTNANNPERQHYVEVFRFRRNRIKQHKKGRGITPTPIANNRETGNRPTARRYQYIPIDYFKGLLMEVVPHTTNTSKLSESCK